MRRKKIQPFTLPICGTKKAIAYITVLMCGVFFTACDDSGAEMNGMGGNTEFDNVEMSINKAVAAAGEDSPIFHGRQTGANSRYLMDYEDPIQWLGTEDPVLVGEDNFCIYGVISSLMTKYEHPSGLYFSGFNNEWDEVQIPGFVEPSFPYSAYSPNYKALKAGWDENNPLDLNKAVGGNGRDNYNQAKHEITRLYMAASAAMGPIENSLGSKWEDYRTMQTLRTRLGFVHARYLDPAWNNAEITMRDQLLAGKPIIALANGHAYFLDKYKNGKFRSVVGGEETCTDCYKYYSFQDLIDPSINTKRPPVTFITHLDPDINLGGNGAEYRGSFKYGDKLVRNSGGIEYWGRVQIENRGQSSRKLRTIVKWGSDEISNGLSYIEPGQKAYSGWYRFDSPAGSNSYMSLDVTIREEGSPSNPGPIRINLQDDRVVY